MFTERARLAQPGFELTEQNAGLVAQLCRQLDGLPLALELAAARVGTLPLSQLVARLDDRFGLLTTGNRSALPRQKTLHALVEWSYSLLAEAERTLFCRLGIFWGGWMLEGAVGVCAGRGLAEAEILPLLLKLTEKSLLQLEDEAGEGRYRMLETIRQFSQEMLAEDGDEQWLRSRHLDYFGQLAQAANQHLRGPEAGYWLNRLEKETENLRAALEWGLKLPEEDGRGLKLVVSLADFWFIRGYLTDGVQWLEMALAKYRSTRHRLRWQALRWAGEFARTQGNFGRAKQLYGEALGLVRELGDQAGLAELLTVLGSLAFFQGQLASAKSYFQEALEGKRQLADKTGIADLLNNFALMASMEGEGDFEAVFHKAGEAGVLYQETGNKRGEAYAKIYLANAYLAQHKPVAARALLSRVEDLNREVKDGRVGSSLACGWGYLAQLEDHYEKAFSFYSEGLAIQLDLKLQSSVQTLDMFASLAAQLGEGSRAVRLLGAADKLRSSLNLSQRGILTEMYKHTLQTIKTQLSEAELEQSWWEGQSMSSEEVYRYALLKFEP